MVDPHLVNPGRAHYCLCGLEILAHPRDLYCCPECRETMTKRREAGR